MPKHHYVYLDIETIPTQDDTAKDYLAANARAPANYKDPDKIAAAKVEAGAKAVDQSVFDGWFGRIACISYAFDDAEPVTRSTGPRLEHEASAIRDLFGALTGNDIQVTIVGHNVAGFDVPFITRRAVQLGITLPPAHRWPRDPKPWDVTLHDTLGMAVGGRDHISLDRLCFALGVPGKGGFDGSMVHDAWQRGDHLLIAKYCADDVRRVRAVHQKFIAAGW